MSPVNSMSYFFLFGLWVNAEPATLFSAFVDLGSLKILAALEATDFEVFSFLAISPPKMIGFRANGDSRNSRNEPQLAVVLH